MFHKKIRPQFPRGGWKQRGFALLLVAMSMFFVIGSAGLAIDAGVLYVVKGRLSAAVDAAALAAGRGINLGTDIASAQTQATASARRFFDANFPAGYLGTDPSRTVVNTNFQQQVDNNNNPTGILTMTVSGQVEAPVYLMRIFGRNSVTVSATGTATRRNLVMVLVLDKSGSMGSRQSALGTLPTTIPANATSCEAMVISAGQFIGYFSPYDYVGMVTFNDAATISYAASSSFKSAGTTGIKNAISNISCGSYTNTTAGLQAAWGEIQRIGQRLALNEIVLFTDGAPNAINMNFPLRTQVDTRFGPAKSINSGNPPNTPTGNRANCLDSTGTKICINMPVLCPTGTVRGVIAQSSFSAYSGTRAGLYKPYSTDTQGTFPNGCPNSGTNMTSQSLAYIPDTDVFGNSSHGPKDNWLFEVNQQCAPAGVPITPGNSACKDIGDYWTNYPTIGVGSNFFTAGPYSGYFRVDHTNTISVVAMNTAINAAANIRSDTNYNVRIDTIYLQGNGSDPVDRDFLPMIANIKDIPPLIYQPVGTPNVTNPQYVQSQQTGMYLQTVNAVELTTLFSQIASSLLRLSS